MISITDCRFSVEAMQQIRELIVIPGCSLNTGVTSMRTDHLRSISEALIASGYTSLDEQAEALGLHRSTAWTIINRKHKLGRLCTKTIGRILTNPQTPAAVRAVVQQYAVQQKSKRNPRGAKTRRREQMQS